MTEKTEKKQIDDCHCLLEQSSFCHQNRDSTLLETAQAYQNRGCQQRVASSLPSQLTDPSHSERRRGRRATHKWIKGMKLITPPFSLTSLIQQEWGAGRTHKHTTLYTMVSCLRGTSGMTTRIKDSALRRISNMLFSTIT